MFGWDGFLDTGFWILVPWEHHQRRVENFDRDHTTAFINNGEKRSSGTASQRKWLVNHPWLSFILLCCLVYYYLLSLQKFHFNEFYLRVGRAPDSPELTAIFKGRELWTHRKKKWDRYEKFLRAIKWKICYCYFVICLAFLPFPWAKWNLWIFMSVTKVLRDLFSFAPLFILFKCAFSYAIVY